MKRIGFALLAACLIFPAAQAQAQAPIARFIYEDAEAAFAQRDYSTALLRLREAEQAFGKLNPPILYLRIQARNELLSAAGETIDFDNLAALRADVKRYLNDYGAMAVLVDQVREVYQISRALERYPASRADHEAKLATQQRAEHEAAERARRAEEERLAAERERVGRPGHSFRDCPQCPEMVVVPGGTLTVQTARGPRQIEIRPFAISRYELTLEQWYQLTGEQVPNLGGHCMTCPVEDRRFSPHGPVGRAFQDIWRLLDGLSDRAGRRYHLPSEAQWEWACRGGQQHRFCGSDVLEEVAWFDKGWTGAQPVGQKKPNGYGLHDMSGNANESTADSWFEDYDPPADGGPRFATDFRHDRIVARGGRALMGDQRWFEAAARYSQPVGVRLARPLLSGWLGATCEDVDGQRRNGARVKAVEPGGAAAQAGIQPGDVIVEADGRPILTQWSLATFMAPLEPGRKVGLGLMRGGQRHRVDVMLAARAEPAPAP